MATATMMMIGVDDLGRVRAASREFLDLTGYESGAIYGRPLSDVTVTVDADRLRITRADGTPVDVTATSCALDGDTSGIRNMVVLTPVQSAANQARALGLSLSERETQILGYVTDGYRVATIAKALYISPSTVRNHLSAIFKKLGVANQAELLERLKG